MSEAQDRPPAGRGGGGMGGGGGGGGGSRDGYKVLLEGLPDTCSWK